MREVKAGNIKARPRWNIFGALKSVGYADLQFAVTGKKALQNRGRCYICLGLGQDMVETGYNLLE